MTLPEETLQLRWSPIYHEEWDAAPDAYVAAGLVGWERSRRLVRADDPTRAFKAYIGVHHSDPSRWGRAEEPHARFFLSLLLIGRTVAFHTYATFAEAMGALADFYQRLGAGGRGQQG